MIDLNDKNILVTGANGMIGKELIRILKEEYKPNVEFEFVIAGCLCMTLKKKPSFFDLDLWISTILVGLKLKLQ